MIKDIVYSIWASSSPLSSLSFSEDEYGGDDDYDGNGGDKNIDGNKNVADGVPSEDE